MRTVSTLILSLVLAPAALIALAGCETAPKSEADRSSLTAEVQATLSRFRYTDPSLSPLLSGAKGYAVFPDVGKAGLVVGGAYGHGELYQGTDKVGFCDIVQGTVGLQFQSAGAFYGGIAYTSEFNRSQIKNDQIMLNLGLRF